MRLALAAGRSRAEHRSADANLRGHLLDRHLEVVAHPHRELGEHRGRHAGRLPLIPQFTQLPEERPDGFGVFLQRRQQHQPVDRDPAAREAELQHPLDFYRRRGYALVKIHPGAVSAARRLKPEIPAHGQGGVPITDEIEFERRL
jgi:hypothetical protein